MTDPFKDSNNQSTSVQLTPAGQVPVSADVTVGDNIGFYPALTIAGRGEVAGSATAAILPTLDCKLVEIKAVWSNAGNVYIGGSTVTKVDGTTDTTTGYELAPGETAWFTVVSNLNELYRICDNAGDDFVYRAFVTP